MSVSSDLQLLIDSMIVDSATTLPVNENLHATLAIPTFLWTDMRNLDRQIP